MPDKPAKSSSPSEPAVPLHIFLSRRMDERPDLTNVEVARRLGYPRPNVIAMIRTGSMRVPTAKVKQLAAILELDATALLQRVLMEYDPEAWETLESVLGDRLVTANELALVKLTRELVRGLDPYLLDNELFVAGFKALLGQALDEQVMSGLAIRHGATGAKVRSAAEANRALEDLCRRQALERIALRRELLEKGPAPGQPVMDAYEGG